jgi:hypothetical protein
MLKRFEDVWIGLFALVWLAILTPWGTFSDPDAFYHAHLSSLILRNGPVQSFPWLDLTSLGTHFADAHFLFHLLLIPAIWIARMIGSGPFAELWGTQVMAPILATGTILILWATLRQIDAKRAWFWTLLAFLIPGLSTRLLLGKASPIAVGLFVAMIGWMMSKKRQRWVAFALIGFLFALSHGGWIILLLGMGAMMTGEFVFEKFVKDASWITAIRAMSWSALAALLIGLIAGILVHPNRVELIQFLLVQVFKAGSGNNAAVMQGGEWLPAFPSFIVYHLAVFLLAGIITLWGIVTTWTSGRVPDAERMKRVVILAMPLALTLALTLNSRRFIEYLAPAMVLWIAALWTLVDEERLITSIRMLMHGWPQLIRRIAPAIAIVGACAVAFHQVNDTWSQLRRAAGRSFGAWRPAVAAISERAQPGDRVFADWDEFPTLFAANDRLKYLGGLDPVFLQEANPALSDAVEDLLRGRVTSTAWDVVANQSGSRFVFVTPNRHPPFAEALRNNPKFEELFRNDEMAAYEVKR